MCEPFISPSLSFFFPRPEPEPVNLHWHCIIAKKLPVAFCDKRSWKNFPLEIPALSFSLRRSHFGKSTEPHSRALLKRAIDSFIYLFKGARNCVRVCSGRASIYRRDVRTTERWCSIRRCAVTRQDDRVVRIPPSGRNIHVGARTRSLVRSFLIEK